MLSLKVDLITIDTSQSFFDSAENEKIVFPSALSDTNQA
jgi:hypothetical protein